MPRWPQGVVARLWCAASTRSHSRLALRPARHRRECPGSANRPWYRAPSRPLATIDALLVMVLSAARAALFVQRAKRDGRIDLHRIMGACG